MKPSLSILTGLILFFTSQGFAQNLADHLGAGQIELHSPTAQAQIDTAMSDLKALIGHFRLALDRSTTVTKAPTLGGTTDHPVYKVSVRKCVFFVCQNADLDLEFSLVQAQGTCEMNLLLDGDLVRSSTSVTDSYSHFQVGVCINKTADGALIKLNGFAVRAPGFSEGAVQGQILSMLKLQFPAVMTALKETLQIP
jgi:hypothetical protein